ncbi:hypothetical protein PR202_ga04708 [Eleusine coracana subsp. coracana]|uniref:Uncharacterized protein n=1 Tax=Eleusine coracana subsp. coracana TaxID=191504 RepID=A0AAV5BR20_ELECO|nr:hypothetical protein PR202_ga04708 [Eleusine coracana subsp. coracana]
MFLLDWGIDGVVVEDSGHLMFYVGPLSQAFPADGFEESPRVPVVPPQQLGQHGCHG